ncbi:hypothetical protein [Actinomadura flavalba]|uniref:hypothetical protein n=1 Tax=Actinomadura flavalba TaxID=1120938 RepID=UPI0003758E34|nr:hypothetical protein [Actinomadura flavalba]
MRFVIILAALALLAVVVVLIVYAARGAGAVAPAGWRAVTESDDGRTRVLVRETGARAGGQLVAEIPDDAPDWEDRLHAAMAQARSRIAALESQRD